MTAQELVSKYQKPLVAPGVQTPKSWFHRIDLGNGIITPGWYDCQKVLDRIGLPNDLKGKSVLDCGCADGFWSIACARRGADVTAIDLDTEIICEVSNYLDIPIMIREIDFMEYFDEFYDIVLFMGLLYHIDDMQGALCKLQGQGREFYIESLCDPGMNHGNVKRIPTKIEIKDMMHIAGFKNIEVAYEYDDHIIFHAEGA